MPSTKARGLPAGDECETVQDGQSSVGDTLTMTPPRPAIIIARRLPGAGRSRTVMDGGGAIGVMPGAASPKGCRRQDDGGLSGGTASRASWRCCWRCVAIDRRGNGWLRWLGTLWFRRVWRFYRRPGTSIVTSPSRTVVFPIIAASIFASGECIGRCDGQPRRNLMYHSLACT